MTDKKRVEDSAKKFNLWKENSSGQTWTWHDYDDLSGHLEAPDGKEYFVYDWATKEYMVTRDSSWDSFVDADPTRDISLGAFKVYAEKYIRNNIAKHNDIIFRRKYIPTTIETENETINTDTELKNRISSAFSIAYSLYPEYAALYEQDVSEDLIYDYKSEETKSYIEKVWETLKSNFDTNNVTQNKNRSDELIIAEEVGTKTLLLADFEALIKGRDAILDGEESLLYIRPNAKQIQSGFEEGWKFDELTKGYAIFQNPDLNVKGGFTPKFISKLDAMDVFESDGEAASQWEKDTHGHLMQERINMWIGDEDLEYYSYPDTPENRKILKENGWLLDQPLEFDNNAEREDDLFNALAERHFVLANGKEVDFNPIKPEKSGTIEQYLESMNRIKENHFQRRKEDYLVNIKVTTENFREVFNEVSKLPKFKDKSLEAAGWCFSKIPKENKAEVGKWLSDLGCGTKKDSEKLFNKWNKENNPKTITNKSKNKSNEVDDWSISE